jgi:hypothetical protein
MRALYQRKKGRDLFDLAAALEKTDVEPGRIVETFLAYMEHGGHRITRALYEQNIQKKLVDPLFTADISALLANGYTWNITEAAQQVTQALIQRLPE